MHKFLVIGLGYIAPKHVQAIADCGHEVTGICDINNTAGWVDKYFPKAKFYYPDELKDEFDYVSICSPNHTHLDYIDKFNHGKIICEKPFVLPGETTGKEVSVILQLRYHNIVGMIKSMENIDIEYYTYRGHWYDRSWKADIRKSGGIACNIGIHILDLLVYCFGMPDYFDNISTNRTAHIEMGYPDRTVNINIDLNKEFRRTINGVELTGFEDLHTLTYHEILAGRGFNTKDALQAISLLSATN